MSQRWSPDDIAYRFRQFQSSCLDRLAVYFEKNSALLYGLLVSTLALSGLGVIHLAQTFLSESHSRLAHSVFKLTILFITVSLAHLPLAPLFLFAKNVLRKFIWILAMALTCLIALSSNQDLSAVQVAVCFIILALEFGSYVALFGITRRYRLRTRLLILLAAMVAQVWLMAWLSSYMNFLARSHYFVHSRWFMVFSYLALEEALLPQSIKNSFFARFSLTNFLDPVPARQSDWTGPKTFDPRLLLQAWYDLLSCFLASLLLIKMAPFIFSSDEWSLWDGPLNYIALFFISYVTIVLPIGILRLYGFQLKDAFELPLLAATPQDRWRRWNTFYYHWFYSMVFWPIYKRSRNIFISCILVFLATYWFHTSHLLFTYNNDTLESPLVLAAGRYLGFFMAHALAVYIGLRFSRYWPSGQRLTGWAGVLLTWFVMSLIHMIKW